MQPIWTILRSQRLLLRVEWVTSGSEAGQFWLPLIPRSDAATPNCFHTYQQNNVNAAYFTVRTRALNGILYWFSQIIGAAVFGYALDYKGLSRPLKARIR